MTTRGLTFSQFPTCRPLLDRRIIFRCWACGHLCCNRSMIKGFLLAYCPHCNATSTLEPIGQTFNLVWTGATAQPTSGYLPPERTMLL